MQPQAHGFPAQMKELEVVGVQGSQQFEYPFWAGSQVVFSLEDLDQQLGRGRSTNIYLSLIPVCSLPEGRCLGSVLRVSPKRIQSAAIQGEIFPFQLFCRAM